MLPHSLRTPLATLLPVLMLGVAHPAMAHCDSMDVPVVQDAQRALSDNDVTPVLKWVLEEDEQAIRDAFEMVVAVRGESDAARQVADRYFFETLLRVHRESEGEVFTGLKPAGSVEPGIAAADRALEEGNVDHLAEEVAEAVRQGVEERFVEAYERRETAEESVEEGREYVGAYVQFTHFVEELDHFTSHGASHAYRENKEHGH